MLQLLQPPPLTFKLIWNFANLVGQLINYFKMLAVEMQPGEVNVQDILIIIINKNRFNKILRDQLLIL